MHAFACRVEETHQWFSATQAAARLKFDAELPLTKSVAQHSTAQHSTAQHSTAWHMRTLRVVLVRMESLFWADSTLIRRKMSICIVMPCRVVNNTIWLLMVSTAAYMAAMLSRPVLTSGRLHRPAAPGTSP